MSNVVTSAEIIVADATRDQSRSERPWHRVWTRTTTGRFLSREPLRQCRATDRIWIVFWRMEIPLLVAWAAYEAGRVGGWW